MTRRTRRRTAPLPSPGRRDVRPGAAVLVLVVLALIQVGPALTGKVLSAFDIVAAGDPMFGSSPNAGRIGNPLLSDPVHVVVPGLLEARERLRSGELPLWSSRMGTGFPLLASQSHTALAPLNLPALVLPVEDVLAWLLALKLLVAGAGVLALGRLLGLSRGAGLLAALGFAFGTYVVAWAQHPQMNVFALLPWALWAGARLALDPSAGRAVTAGAIGGAMLLGGHPRVALLLAPLLAAWWIAWTVWSGSGRSMPGRAAAFGLGALVLALSIGALAWLPFLGALADSYGSSQTPGETIPFRALLSVALPEYWGRPDAVSFEGPLNWPERTIYVGAPVILLALAGLLRPRRREPVFLLVASTLALLVTLDAPLLGEAFRAVPGFDDLDLNRLMVVPALGLPLLAAFGLDALRLGPRETRRRIARAAWVVAALPLVALVADASVRTSLAEVTSAGAGIGRDASTAAEAGAASVLRWIVIALPAVLLIRTMRERPPKWAAPALVALAAADLAALGAGYHTFLPADRAMPDAPAALTRAAATGSMERAAGIEVLAPNLGQRFGVRDPRVNAHPPVGRYGLLWTELAGGSAVRTRLTSSEAATDKLLDLTAVSVVVAPLIVSRPAGAVPMASGQAGISAYRNLDAHPRAFFSASLEPARDVDDAMRRVRRASSARLRRRPVVEGVRARRGDAGGRVRFLTDTPEEVVLEVDAEADGLVTLLDALASGWRVQVDGTTAPIRPVNVAFRGVLVPAGRHVVRFSYEPREASTGLALSATGVAVVLLWALGTALVRRRRPVIRIGRSPAAAPPPPT